MAEWARADRPPLRPRSTPTAREDADRDPRRDGHDRRHGDRRRRPPPRARAAPSAASPSPRSGRSPPPSCARPCGGARAVAVVERTDEPLAAAQPADARGQGGAVRRAPRTARRSRASCSVSAGLGSRDVAAGDLVAVFDWLAEHGDGDHAPYAVLGIRHPLALDARRRRPPAGRRVQPARPLDRRLRLASPPTSCSPRSSASCSACTSRPTRATARRRRACRRPTT